ncbi:MAG: cell division/cell wall cluster transcriptional repressor MraZ [Bacteroidaceae bacterium]|nr:cell division/cell wall cluster transcriptional repressor MraZ [Bacteroidaceae bacterium]
MRFIGNIEAKIDQKGRAFLPAVFRRVLQTGGEERLILRKDVFANCLVVMPESELNLRLDQLKERLSIWNAAHQRLFRQYVTDMEWLTLDSNGRFLIPKRYLQKVGIVQDVVFVGVDSAIEIWALEEKKRADQQDAAVFAEQLQEEMK